MPFFARPNLDDTQFKQLTGSTLTLSGTTHIVTPSGLTLSDGGGGNVVITAKGADFTKNGYVLTYDYPTNQIGLCLSAGSGGTQIYCGTSPTTCTVGGLNAGTSISGKTLSCIIQDIVAPALNPVLTSPYIQLFTLSYSPPLINGFYEVLTPISIIGNTTFSLGCINPQYGSAIDTRSKCTCAYCYWSSVSGTALVPSNFTTNSNPFALHPITANETYTVKVCYSGGCTALNSCGQVYAAALSAGATPISTLTVSAIYPYFWGVSTTAPDVSSTPNAQSLINGGTKVLNLSNAPITIDFNISTPNKYIWLAIPTTSGLKNKWYGSNAPTTNTEPIPNGATGLFNTPNAPRTITGINSPTVGLWTNVSYDFYVSNYATNTCSGTQYTITFTP